MREYINVKAVLGILTHEHGNALAPELSDDYKPLSYSFLFSKH